MKCPKCDLKNPAKSLFCSKCGTKLSPKKAPKKKTPKKKAYVSQTKTIKATQTSSEDLTTGSTFAGRYQVIEELGKGGMAALTYLPVQRVSSIKRYKKIRTNDTQVVLRW